MTGQRFEDARAALNAARATQSTGTAVASLFDDPAESPQNLFIDGRVDAGRDEAIARVANTWRGEITERLDVIVLELARARSSFTVDDVHDRIPADLESVDMRLLGAVVRSAAKRRIVRAGGYLPSRRRHSSPVREWVSLICEADR